VIRRLSRTGSSVLAVLLIGACTVTTSDPREDDSRAVERFREQKAVEYDLTEPRTAQELGVEPGRDSAIFDRDSSEYWDVTFQLPGGTTFTTGRAIAVGVFIDEEPAGLLNYVGINVRALSVEELAELLQRDVTQLGLQPTEVQDVLGQLSRRDRDVVQVLDGKSFGYLGTSVEVRTSTEHDRIAVNYQFGWEPGVAVSTPSAG
jgi:hypothetical protein